MQPTFSNGSVRRPRESTETLYQPLSQETELLQSRSQLEFAVSSHREESMLSLSLYSRKLIIYIDGTSQQQ